MTGLERQLTKALRALSKQYDREQRRHAERAEALQRLVERQTAQSEALQRQVERLRTQVTRLTDYFRTAGATSPGHRG